MLHVLVCRVFDVILAHAFRKMNGVGWSRKGISYTNVYECMLGCWGKGCNPNGATSFSNNELIVTCKCADFFLNFWNESFYCASNIKLTPLKRPFWWVSGPQPCKTQNWYHVKYWHTLYPACFVSLMRKKKPNRRNCIFALHWCKRICPNVP